LTGMGRNDEARKMGFEGLEVARQVLDRRPGHMPALRAHALIAGGIARSEAEALRLRKAVQMTEPAVRDWETYLKLDPGNSVAWNNLAANHTGLGFAYDSLGRSDEALAHFRRVGEILRKFPGLAVGLLNPAGRMAVLDAEFGRPHDGAPEYRKLVEEATRTLPPGSFMAMGLVEIADDYDRQVALVEGRNEAARDLALAAYKRMAAFKISSAGQDRLLQRGLAGAAYEAAFALGVLKDYPAAETQARLAIEHSQKTLPRAVDELVALAQTRVLLAIALAREGRNPEAAALLETDLKYLRGLVSRGTEDLNHHFTLAQALYADAIAQPAQARALLAEAAALIDKMPKDMSRRKSVAQLRGWIAEEQGRR
jgi:tetratricopeptide (TPR) repeat protein